MAGEITLLNKQQAMELGWPFYGTVDEMVVMVDDADGNEKAKPIGALVAMQWTESDYVVMLDRIKRGSHSSERTYRHRVDDAVVNLVSQIAGLGGFIYISPPISTQSYD